MVPQCEVPQGLLWLQIFSWRNGSIFLSKQFCNQYSRISMSAPVSPVDIDIFMETFQFSALELSCLKPKATVTVIYIEWFIYQNIVLSLFLNIKRGSPQSLYAELLILESHSLQI